MTDEIVVTKEEIEVGKIALATLVQMGYELRLQRPAAMQTPNKDLRTIEHAATTFVANMALYANLAIEAVRNAERCDDKIEALDKEDHRG